MAEKRKRIDRSIKESMIIFTVLATGQTVEADAKAIVGGDAAWEAMSVIGRRLVLHGLNAKAGDSAADPNADAAEQIQAVVDQLNQGLWTVRGGAGGPRTTILAEAMSRVTGKDLDVVVDMLDSLEPKERDAIPKKFPKVQAVMDEIKAQRAAEKAAKSAENAGEDEGNLDALFGDAA